ncbi:serine hydrolase [Rheinheimera sp. FR7-31]|uniref:serine hydrolase domain-containing protein n=1 Tax=Rheinheimera fenheensis TaxID=3152295 RepID=UPI00325E0D0B
MKISCFALCALAFSGLTLANNYEEISPQIAELKPQQLSSVLVMHNGNLVHESYYNGVTAEDLHDIRSASKTFTGLMFGRAIADGYFKSEQDKVLPIFNRSTVLNPSEEKSNMTFFDLLSMTNPLECDDNNDLSAGHEERMYLTKDWVNFFLNLPARANPPWEKPMEQQPYGRDFAYCTAGISVAAAAIEVASKQKLSEYTKTALFKPLGINESEWLYNAMGTTQGGGGVRIKPKDLIKIGQLILNKGSWAGKQVLPKEWIEKSLQSYSESMPELNATYGITWWRLPFNVNGKVVDSFAAAGNGGNYMFVVPELNAVAVITATAYNTRYMHQQTHAIFSTAILPALIP